MFLGRETVENHSQLPKKALGRLQAFRMYGGIGMSASSLHRLSDRATKLGDVIATSNSNHKNM